MNEEDDYEVVDMICPRCNGSGETISGAPGNCSLCRGSGGLKYLMAMDKGEDDTEDEE